jgi:hypothetical protein
MNISANFSVINLNGQMGLNELGDGVSATTVHRVYCLDAGSIEIEAMGGGTFTWEASKNDYIDVMVRSIDVSTGIFIGFKAKNDPYRFNTKVKF